MEKPKFMKKKHVTEATHNQIKERITHLNKHQLPGKIIDFQTEKLSLQRSNYDPFEFQY